LATGLIPKQSAHRRDGRFSTKAGVRLAATAALAGFLLSFCTRSAAPQGNPDPAAKPEKRPLVFLGDKDYPPLSYLDGNKAVGMDVDVAKALGLAIHREVRVELLEWHAAQEKMLRGEGNGLLLMSITEDREKLYDFTEPILTHSYGIFVRGNDLTVRGLSDLAQRSVGVTAGGYPREVLKAQPLIHTVLVANYEDGFDRLAKGGIDALAADSWVGQYILQRHKWRNFRIAGEPIVKVVGALAVRKGDSQLLAELNEGIRKLKADGTLAQIQEHWRPQEVVFLTRESLQRYIEWGGALALLIVMGALAVWISTLKRQIRARRKVESALVENREQFLMAASAACMGTWRWTVATDESIRDANVNQILGLGPVETKTGLDDFFKRIHDEDRAGVKAEFDRAIENRDAYGAEFRVVRPDGTIRWMRTQGKPFYTARGELAYMTGASLDVTETKAVAEELRRVRDFTSTLVQTSPAYFVALNAEYKVLMMNQAMLSALGYRKEEVIGREYLRNFVPEKEQAGVETIFEQALKGMHPPFSTNHIQTSAGKKLLVEWSGQCIFKPDHQLDYFFGVGIDITERTRSAQEKIGLELQLRQAQKMETVGRLAGGVAHDFNNLLTVINGYSDLLIEELRTQARARKQAEEIKKAGERATNLTQQLLAVSRRQVTEPCPLRLGEVVTEAAKMLGRLLGEDVKLEVRLGAVEDQVLAEPGQIHQILMNLAVNARDAMPQGGKLLIATSNVEVDSREVVEDEEVASGAYVLLSIRDSGTGMSEETRQHIFEPFYTTKETGKGTGLGLSIVYGIVRQSNGFIRMETAQGEGTVFHIYLPRDYAALPSAAPIKRNTADLHGTETVLVVEDQENVRAFTTQILKTHGYLVLEASHGAAALELMQRHLGEIDVLLTDLVMPGMNGKVLAEHAKRNRPRVKILFMSGYSDDVLGHRGVLEPGLAYVQKPFAAETLLTKMREVAASQTQQKSILVVDDDESVLNFLHDILSQMGFRVHATTNGAEVSNIVDREDPAVVITDLVMPVREGIETIRMLRQQFPAVKVIAMSGAFSGQFLRAAKHLGADATLRKPIRREVLERVLKELAETGAFAGVEQQQARVI
jgi:two-component system cell cycle sensor histidine kinase/response regulator CckA